MIRLLALVSIAVVVSACATLDVPTTLPAEVHVREPGPEIPPQIAAFSGVWSGAWDHNRFSQTLVVEFIMQITPTHYHAQIVMGWGDKWPGRIGRDNPNPGHGRFGATISGDGATLRVDYGQGQAVGRSVTYTMSPDRTSLASEYSGPNLPGTQHGVLRRTQHFQTK